MEMLKPLVTVLMPAYNAADYIAEAITSVLEQSFANFELLIVNDGSTDNTVEVIRCFNDERIVLINRENGGVAEALNTGLKHARADYIARFDADDVCHPTRLELQYDFMRSNPDYIILGSAADYMDMCGNYVFNYQPPAHSNEHLQLLNCTLCPFVHSTVFYKRQAVIDAGGYNKNALGFEDHLLWRSLVKKGKVFNFSQSLIRVRLNPKSVTIDERWCAKEFLNIKYSAIQKGAISDRQGADLYRIALERHRPNVKQGAYYALLAKKFLWNNHQPVKARQNLKQAILVNRFDVASYALFMLSFLPGGLLLKLYNTIK
jgi:glycosyltransferase involved in cell wall biosynthesis